MPAKRRTRVLAQSSATSAAASSLSSPSSAAAAATSAATTKRRSATTSRKGRGGKGAAGRGRIRGAGGRGGAGSVVTAEALPVATSSCNLVGVLTLSETALRLLRANPQADVVLDWINSQSAQPARPVVPTLAVGSSRFSLLEVSAPPHAHADVVVRQRHQCNFAGTISKEFQLSDMVVCDSSSENELRRLLLHQLAPKPLMRQHILDQWEGRESLVNKVLDEIAKSQSNGALILRNRAYLEVRPFEWQLYTEIERDTVIRNGRIAFTDLRLSPSAPEWRNLEPLPAVPSGLAVSLNEPVPAGTRSRVSHPGSASGAALVIQTRAPMMQ
ncbi:hypothetical protein DFJ73DRAFT_526952 [Zopfochytrium polystomum]|nr:hypothetical protein DFJ73DRAFT_526952 [Zopfochytrium polystomum]